MRIHDLVTLAKKINAPTEILDICIKLNPVYIDTRYPDVPRSYNKKEVKELINDTERVLKWIKQNL